MTPSTTRWSLNRHEEIIDEDEDETLGVYLISYGVGTGAPRAVVYADEMNQLKAGYVIAYSITSKTLNSQLPWLNDFISDDNQEVSASKIRDLYINLDDMLKRGEFNLLEKLLDKLPSLDMSFELKSATLRYLLPAKQKFKNWVKIYEQLHSDFEALELDTSEILRGLK